MQTGMENIPHDFKLTNELGDILIINNIHAAAVCTCYREFLTMIDNVIEGNVQCEHCYEWFSKKRINAGEMQDSYEGDGNVVTDEKEWIKLHYKNKCSRCYNGDHIKNLSSIAFLRRWSQEHLLVLKDPQNIAKQLVKRLDEFNTFLKTNSVELYRELDDFNIVSDYGSVLMHVTSTLNICQYKDMERYMKNSKDIMDNVVDRRFGREIFVFDTSFYNYTEILVLFSLDSDRFNNWVTEQITKYFSNMVKEGQIYSPAISHYGITGASVYCDSCQKTITDCIGLDKYDVCVECASKYIKRVEGKSNIKGDMEFLYDFLQNEYKRKMSSLFGEQNLNTIACKKGIMCFLLIARFKKDTTISQVPKDVLLIIAKMLWKERDMYLKRSNTEK
jgi:hypothetical protein